MVPFVTVVIVLTVISWLGWRLVTVEQQRHLGARERLVKRLGNRRRQRSLLR
ncbi:hypothetical protein SynWH8103_01661 [Synechococcus sp. WH 8103]|nr:putative conserved secreted protein [Synechococcus sp. RS9915]QNJ14333.1 putative conserved secreted protein [Synechococcus sp. A18-46.1]QNJ17138.1 putative conserved secreted protein [Synechococcus sp. A18-40]CRY92389.1 hypothetical protein SynWH8103_01661 [Synechococcus sp. WH 8103]